MAEKRMFSNRVIDSDAFCDMSFSAQALYFHLNLQADDDGIVNRAHKIQRAVGATQEDFDELVRNRFILIVDGVAIIKHWWMNNNLRSDRKQDTAYPEILAKLKVKENGAYTLLQPNDNQTATTCQPTSNQVTTNGQPSDNQTATNRQPNDNQTTTERRQVGAIDKYSIDKNSIDKNSLKDIDHRSGDHAQEQPEVVTLLEKRFEEFWELYPRKVGKLKAFQSFKRINPKKELFDQMMDALRENIASNAQWKRDNGQYIPHPTTWLNQGRWFDEISTDAPGAAEDFFTRALKGEVDY